VYLKYQKPRRSAMMILADLNLEFFHSHAVLAILKCNFGKRPFLPFVLVIQHHRIGVELAEIGQRIAFKAKSTTHCSCPRRTFVRRHGGGRTLCPNCHNIDRLINPSFIE